MANDAADPILRDCRLKMDKSTQYFENELRGIRTGRATTALIEHIKVDYYGNHTDLREIAAISVPEPTQLLVKPFDPSAKNDIVKSLETAGLGFNPQVEGTSVRINIPPPSKERRQQLVNQVRKMAEEARIAVRNERRDAIKAVDALTKDKSISFSEDQGKAAKSAIEDLTKEHIETIDASCEKKVGEVLED